VRAADVGDRLWTPVQALVWVTNALGNFVPSREIIGVIDSLDHRPGERARTLPEALERLRLPVLRSEERQQAMARHADQALFGAVRHRWLIPLEHPGEGLADMLRFKARDVVALWPHPDAAKPGTPDDGGAADKGGAPYKYDWKAAEAALDEECRLQESIPVRDHSDREWRTRADAMRWLRDRFSRQWRDGGPADSTLKKQVGEMLQRIAARMKKAGN
jgi:hypothetical protein